MWLQRLHVQGLRCFSQCELEFTPAINVLYGDNGAGKTSILEAISLLSCGSSFRTHQFSHIIHQDINEMLLYGEVNASDSKVKLGVKKSHNYRELHVNGEAVQKWADLAKNLPVLEIHPESYLLVTGGPVQRRKFLNWGMFHVEPSYAQTWSEYIRAVKQRNTCLKARQIVQARHWNQSLSQMGESIAQQLRIYSEKLVPYINQIISSFSFSDDFKFDYYPGWDQRESLEQQLENELVTKDLAFTTLNGPHRGDLKIYWHNKPFAKISSRGQQKILAIALKIAQAQILRDQFNKSCVYLIDELPAELDSLARATALKLLTDIDSQVIISAVAKDSVNIENNDIKWFHVEHGGVSAVL